MTSTATATLIPATTEPDHETDGFDRKFRQLVAAWLLHDDLRGTNADLGVRMTARTELDAARLAARQAQDVRL